MITDALEIQLLSQLQAKRAAEMRVQSQQEWGLRRMTDAMNGVTMSPTATPLPAPAQAVVPVTAANRIADPINFKAPDGIMNRSPITNNHYHTYPAAPTVVVEPQPSQPPVVVQPTATPAPPRSFSPWWLLIPAALIIAGATYLLWPKRTLIVTPPVIQPAPPVEKIKGGIIWRQVP